MGVSMATPSAPETGPAATDRERESKHAHALKSRAGDAVNRSDLLERESTVREARSAVAAVGAHAPRITEREPH